MSNTYNDSPPQDDDAWASEPAIPEEPSASSYEPEQEQQVPQSVLDDAEAEENFKRKGVSEQQHNGRSSTLKEAATQVAKDKLLDNVPGGQTVEKAEKAASFTRNIISDVKNTAAMVKSGAVAFFNPVTLWTLLIVTVIAVIIITVMAISQVYGQTKSTVSSVSASSATLERLAQRAEWLQKNVANYPSTAALTSLGADPKSSLSDNAWTGSCPNIVGIIYGLSPYLTGYMGANNAYFNYRNNPELYEAWAFSSGSGTYGAYGDGTSSPGAVLSEPPPGAIVSVENQNGWYQTNYPGAGHTFVMLTDELVIDNFSGGGVSLSYPGVGPRVVSDQMRSHIVGWALPKSEAFEGTFITGSFEGQAETAPDQAPMPDLPPVPNYLGTISTGGSDE